MKKLIVLFGCFFLLTGCMQTEQNAEIKLERKIEAENEKFEVYEAGYEEGYKDAVEDVIEEVPWYLINGEDLENALYEIFDDGEYAEEIRDQILSYCQIYESIDFSIDYTDDGIDYNF